MDGPLFKDVEAANNGRLQLVRGQDSDNCQPQETASKAQCRPCVIIGEMSRVTCSPGQ